jgi:eukaryotic-like serine/threonine-protein kinase
VIDSVDTLLTVIRRVQIFAPEQVDEIERELVPHFTNPWELARHLVRIEWLSPYQYELLFAGEWEKLSIGTYTVLDRLGSGGVSEVYKAWDTVRGRVVALKVLRLHLASQRCAVRQFERELAALPRLNHPNVIRTFEAHRLGDLHYFAMEYVEGRDLSRYVQDNGPLSVEHASEYIRQVAQGLQHAHQYSLVHRDIKPANLFLINPPIREGVGAALARRGPDPLVKIIDWGLARIPLPPDQANEAARAGEDSEYGLLTGTADYVSPEQARDARIVDTRSDIYSLGCTFVYLLTGQPPFPGRTLMQKLLHHQQSPPPSLREIRRDVPEELEQIIHKMMAKDPAERFHIPLLIVSPLRKFGPGASAGSVIRSPGSGTRPILKGVGKPLTGLNLSCQEPGQTIRPATDGDIIRRPGNNGTPSR